MLTNARLKISHLSTQTHARLPRMEAGVDHLQVGRRAVNLNAKSSNCQIKCWVTLRIWPLGRTGGHQVRYFDFRRGCCGCSFVVPLKEIVLSPLQKRGLERPLPTGI